VTYVPRIADAELTAQLEASGAVVVEGPKAVGKTETARRQAASLVLLDVDAGARAAAAVDPELILEGDTPRLIDEWQLEPSVWNHIRRVIDDRRLPGQFILTGSAVPADDVTRHTGAGRIARLRLRPMSLAESGHSSGAVSLDAVFAGTPPRAADPGMTITKLVDLLCTGGWPAIAGLSVPVAQRRLRAYLDEIARADIQRVDGIGRDPVKVARVLRSLARHVATEVTATTIAADFGGAEGPVDRDTIASYLHALERLMVIEDQPAWAPALRSRSRLRTSPKRHFVDPCLAVASLSATPEMVLKDLNFAGFLFESLVIRDLRVYAQHRGGRVLCYRDNTGLEIDAIVEMPDGRWAAFEIKLGAGRVDAGVRSLLRFAERVDVARCGEPVLLAVVTATGFAYLRRDGVGVVPIATLGP
jgi:uncharacterized protein